MRDATDEMLHENKAGFRPSRSTSDQIATLCKIVEQSLEWRCPLYLNFVDYEKAVDSLVRNVLWDLMACYGIPKKTISLARNLYEGTSCHIIHVMEVQLKSSALNRNQAGLSVPFPSHHQLSNERDNNRLEE